MNFIESIYKGARENQRKIVFAEAGFSPRIIEATTQIIEDNLAIPVLVGSKEDIIAKSPILSKADIKDINDPKLFKELSEKLYELRKHKGITMQQAETLVKDPYYTATMLVVCGYADASIGGCECSTANFLRPSLQLLKGEQGSSVCSYFMMTGENTITDNEFILADCALLENPTSDQLVTIAEACVSQMLIFTNNEPKVAFLSYSTEGSGSSDIVDKSRIAFEKFKAKNPNVKAIGEAQFDAATIERVAKHKLNPNADFYGGANILVFPDLQSANICYKAISYFGNINAVGPITCGLGKPVNDLSRGASVKDIVLLSAVTSMQCK